MTGTVPFQAGDLTAVYNERLAIIFGLITLVLLVSVFLSCRVCISWLSRPGLRATTRLKGYSTFYKYHLYYWWALGVSLVAHIMISTLHTGLSESSDPYAGVHWAILGLGLFSGISALSLFFSCRVLPRLAAMVTPKKPMNNNAFRVLYKYHSYYWLILALLVGAHFITSYYHAGVWPS